MLCVLNTDAGVFVSFMNIVSALLEGQKIVLKETHTLHPTHPSQFYFSSFQMSHISFIYLFFF